MINVFKKIKHVVMRLQGVDVLNVIALRKMGLDIGENCLLMGGVKIDYGHCKHIKIGNNVILAPRVYLLAHDTSTKPLLGYTRIGKINIENNVFIGAQSIILPNVSIGENSIIGAGSIVTSNIPANVVASGNPAKIICSIEEYTTRKKKEFDISPKFDEPYSERNINSFEKRKKISKEMNQKMVNGVGYLK